MAHVEGLNQRGSRYYLLVLIPKDLQASYEGRTKVNLALGTSDKAEAVHKGLHLRAQWLDVSQLMTCHAIYMLPGWQKSKGASLEYFIAKRLGLTIYEHALQDDVLEEQLQALANHGSKKPKEIHEPACA